MAFVSTTIVGAQGSPLWITLTYNDANGHGQSGTITNSTGSTLVFTASDGTNTATVTVVSDGQPHTFSLPANVVVISDTGTPTFSYAYHYI